MKKLTKLWFFMALALMLTLTAFAASENEDNGGITTATAISVNTAVTGNLSDSWDYDYYKFTITENQMIQLSLSTTGSKPHHKIQLLDASGNEYFETNLSSTDDANPYYSNRYNLPAGTYYVRIKPYSTSSSNYNGGTYTLQVLQETASSAGIRETEDNDGVTTADAILVNTNYVGNLEDSWDYDYYKFTLTQSGNVEINLTTAGSKPHYKISLSDSSSSEYFSKNLYSTSDPNPYTSNSYNLPAGTYYVLVKPYSTSSSNYNGNDYILNVSVDGTTVTTTPDTTTPVVTPTVTETVTPSTSSTYEIEDNGSITIATAISVNTTVTGNISSSSDEDYYKVTLSQGDILSVTFNWTGEANFFVGLKDATGTTIESWYSTNSTTGVTTLDRYNLPAGDYYVLISNRASYLSLNNAAYSFVVNAEYGGTGMPSNVETEYNDSIPTADPTVINQTYIGSISNSDDDDYYKFSLSQSALISLTFSWTGEANYYVAIEDSTGNVITSWYSTNSTVGLTSLDSQTLSAGDYYIQVTNRASYLTLNNGDYSILASSSGSTATTTFTDVPSGAWYETNVNAVAAAGIINGKSDGIFAPTDNITYAETAKLAAVVHSQLCNNNYNFTTYGNWYDVYFDYLSQYGFTLLNGVDANQNLTRLQFAQIMSGVLTTFTYTEASRNTVADNAIPDVSSTYSYVYDLYRAGILTGSDTAGSFLPYSNISRAEVAAIVHRFIDTNQRKTITLY